MDAVFAQLHASDPGSTAAALALERDGFVVIDGVVPATRLPALAAAYDRVVKEATAPDAAVGRTSTRVHDLVNRGAEFDELYICPLVLAACCRLIRRPFRLSSLLARTLHPKAGAQDLHRDCPGEDDGWPLVGFIVMIDAFRAENGATRFVPGSDRAPTATPRTASGGVPACGPAGSVIVYNGAVLHGHGPNETDAPRRSIQGAYVRRDVRPAMDWGARMRGGTLRRLGPIARYLLDV